MTLSLSKLLEDVLEDIRQNRKIKFHAERNKRRKPGATWTSRSGAKATRLPDGKVKYEYPDGKSRVGKGYAD